MNVKTEKIKSSFEIPLNRFALLDDFFITRKTCELCNYYRIFCNSYNSLVAHLCLVKINSQSKKSKMKTKLLNTLTAVILFLMPNVNFGQAPNLGTAADFVLFSSNGAVSNGVILSQLTGNVGTDNGSSTGFGNVNGVMNDANGVSAQCKADLLLAYNK